MNLACRIESALVFAIMEATSFFGARRRQACSMSRQSSAR